MNRHRLTDPPATAEELATAERSAPPEELLVGWEVQNVHAGRLAEIQFRALPPAEPFTWNLAEIDVGMFNEEAPQAGMMTEIEAEAIRQAAYALRDVLRELLPVARISLRVGGRLPGVGAWPKTGEQAWRASIHDTIEGNWPDGEKLPGLRDKLRALRDTVTGPVEVELHAVEIPVRGH